MRLPHVVGAVTVVGAVLATLTVAIYTRIIRWSESIDEDTYATVHPINPGMRNHG